MRSPARPRIHGRRLWPGWPAAALVAAVCTLPGGALAATPATGRAASVARAAARDTPTEVIDAKTNPHEAAEALDTGCADIHHCQWQFPNPLRGGYGPPRILGDVLYNCNTDEEDTAETAVGVSDERTEMTSVSEEVSLKVSLGLLGLASVSAEFKAFSKQANGFSTEVSTTNAVFVPAGYKGYTTTQVLSANGTGNTFITEGINKLIEVTNIDLSFPGYQDPHDRSDSRVIYNSISVPMTADDVKTRCDAVSDIPTDPSLVFGAAARGLPPTGTFELTLCQTPDAACTNRKVTGPRPPAIGQATATLTARGRTYAAGTDTAGRIQLLVRRPIRAGKYTLTIRKRLSLTRSRGRLVTHYRSIVTPITIG